MPDPIVGGGGAVAKLTFGGGGQGEQRPAAYE